MRVLIACEESQRVCIAFREKGHEAYSCDIQECSGEHPEWHITGDGSILRAYYLNSNVYQKEISGAIPLATNNQMEILAVIKSLESLKIFDVPIIIYTDSQYVVNTINLGWKKRSNIEHWDRLDSLLKKFRKIEFQWVQGHQNNEGNIIADKLATNAIKEFKKSKK